MHVIRFMTALAALFLSAVALAGPVNINTADAETLSEELKGIGLAKAEAIVAYRDQNGPFSDVAELADVKGIGERTVEINRDNIVVTDRQKPAR